MWKFQIIFWSITEFRLTGKFYQEKLNFFINEIVIVGFGTAGKLS